MTTDRLLSAAIVEVLQFFVGDETLGEALHRVSHLSCQALSADMAGVTMLVDAKLTTAVFTDAEAPAIDVKQYRTGQGPCVEAWLRETIVRIDDMSIERRWPDFVTCASAHGIASTLSIPLKSTGASIGALNLYSRRVSNFKEFDVESVQVWGLAISSLLANAKAFQDARELNQNLRQALRAQATVDQAIGILMANSGRSCAEAFDTLSRASQADNCKIRDVAQKVVAQAQKPQSDFRSGLIVTG